MFLAIILRMEFIMPFFNLKIKYMVTGKTGNGLRSLAYDAPVNHWEDHRQNIKPLTGKESSKKNKA